MRLIPIALALAAALASQAHAQQPVRPVLLEWTLATTYVDGAPLPLASIATTRLRQGTCGLDNVVATVVAEFTVPAPARTFSTPPAPSGPHCFDARTRLVDGSESVSSTPVRVTIGPAPQRPTALAETVGMQVAYVVSQSAGFIGLVPVGWVPDNTQCHPLRSVGDDQRVAFLVPLEALVLPEGVTTVPDRPIFAECRAP